MELSAKWSELGIQGSCPYSPDEQEFAKHSQDYGDLEAVQKLKM